MKCQKSPKNVHLNFPESNVASLNCKFCPNNSPKHRESSFMIVNDTEKQQIFTLKRLNQEAFLLFYLQND